MNSVKDEMQQAGEGEGPNGESRPANDKTDVVSVIFRVKPSVLGFNSFQNA